MTTPQLPGVFFDVTTATAGRLHVIDSVVYLIGEGGTSASASFADGAVLGPFGSATDFVTAVGTDGMLSQAGQAIFANASPAVYVGHLDKGGAKPTIAETVAALRNVRQLSVTPSHIYPPGLTAGVTADPAKGDDTTTNAVASALKALATEFDCVAVADAAHTNVKNASDWADNNVGERMMAVCNRVDDGYRDSSDIVWTPAGGHWLGAALAVASVHGRQRGVTYAPVPSAGPLEFQPTSSTNPTTSTELRTLIQKYVSVLFLRQGTVQIVGDQFSAPSDSRGIWSVLSVLDHLDRVLRAESLRWISTDGKPSTLVRIANALEEAGRNLVRDGELAELVIVPDPERNDAAARAARQAYFDILVTTIVPISQIRHEIVINT